jgi:hypothetical protein
MDVELTADSWGYTYDLERTGEYDIPILQPVQVDFSQYKWVPFNYATGIKADHKGAPKMGVHFFVNDYIFKSIWGSLGRYTDMMRKFGCMCTPQFSSYLDYPKALQIYNYYRSMAVGAFWQRAGYTVIPTMYTGLIPNAYEWCFEGLPKNGSVAVSTNGLGKSKGERKLFVLSFYEMIKRIHPYNIFWYGEYYNECDEYKDLIFEVPSYSAQRWRGKRSDNTFIEGKTL